MKICALENCLSKCHAKGYCDIHYMRFKRHGDPQGSAMRQAFEDRFMDKVDATGDGCWEWTAAKEDAGYGIFSIARSRTRRAHRVSYELHVGPIPDGLVIDHLCRNKGCVRPEHLEAVTGAENVRRGLGGILRVPKSHCRHGHEYTEANKRMVNAGGYPSYTCRTCESLRNDRRREARRAAKCLEEQK